MSEEISKKQVGDKRAIRSFVLRAGRMTPGQKKAMETCWPSMGVAIKSGTANYAEMFRNTNEVVLEIGFGMGDSLVELASQNPSKNYIGIEVYPPGIGKLMQAATALQLNNIRVYAEDAIDVLQQSIPDASLSAVLLFFPDPWPKKKHHKRRIVQSTFAQLIRSKLKLGGILHMATDWQPYAEHMLDIMMAAQGYENCAPDKGFSQRPASRPITKFEQRGERLGHSVADLVFKRVA